ncbi:MAG: hypothetical protein WC846_04655 [Candidatus Gracilibacteria bacterium]|jgi:hypothetical protein
MELPTTPSPDSNLSEDFRNRIRTHQFPQPLESEFPEVIKVRNRILALRASAVDIFLRGGGGEEFQKFIFEDVVNSVVETLSTSETDVIGCLNVEFYDPFITMLEEIGIGSKFLKSHFRNASDQVIRLLAGKVRNLQRSVG